MKNIEIRSRSAAQYFSPENDVWAAISVATYDGDWPKLSACKRLGLLQIFFPDISFKIKDNSMKYNKLFDEEMAQRIFDFVDGIKDKIDTMLIHCEAGVSRSPAIAAAIDRIYFGEKNVKEKYFMKYRPNILVYQTMIALAAKQNRIKLESEIPITIQEIEVENEVPLEIID